MSENKGMKGREIDFIPDRLIEEPVVFRGLTDTEVVTIIMSALAFWVPVCSIILSLFEKALFGVGLGFGLAIVTLLIAGKKLTVMKRRMPDGLHIVAIKKFIQEKTPVSFGYIDKSQAWDIRRTYKVEKVIQEDDE